MFDLSLRRPQQTRQPGTAGGQGNVVHRGGNKEIAQPTNIPVAKSMFSIIFITNSVFYFFSVKTRH